MSPDSNNTVLACPGLKPGYVYVRLNDINKSTPIKAHENALSQIALNLDGTKLATASEQVSRRIVKCSFLIGLLLRVLSFGCGIPTQANKLQSYVEVKTGPKSIAWLLARTPLGFVSQVTKGLFTFLVWHQRGEYAIAFSFPA